MSYKDNKKKSDDKEEKDLLNQEEKDSSTEYGEDEFNPDEWEKENNNKKNRSTMQKGLAIFACLVSIMLFGALFVVEFRSFTKTSIPNTPAGNHAQEDGDDKNKENVNTIMSIIETGTNYTIYLDNQTGVEYVMFRVGSTITIQPLINADGSYKQYVEPTQGVAGDGQEPTSKKGLFDGFKQPTKEAATKSVEKTSKAANEVATTSAKVKGAEATSQMETVSR